MKPDKPVYVGIRIPQQTVIEAKKYVAERPGLTLSRLYEQAVLEFIQTHKNLTNTQYSDCIATSTQK